MRLLPGHCGQHSSGNRSGSGQGKGGQRRAGHCTWPLCGWTRPSQVSGRRWRRPLPFSPSPWRTSPGLPMCPPTHPLFLPIRVADSPDSDTGGRGRRGGGSLLRWGTLSQQRHSLGEGGAMGRGEAPLPPGHAALPALKAYRWGQAIPRHHPPTRPPHHCSCSGNRDQATGGHRRPWGRPEVGSGHGLPGTGIPDRGLGGGRSSRHP